MYCPKCNQQQASEELRFCSRCGFPLAGVALLLANQGALPVSTPSAIPGRRGRIIKESLALTLASWTIALLGTVAWDWGSPLETIAKVGSLIFFLVGVIGLLRFLFAFLFVKDASYVAAEPVFPVVPRQSALPPQQEIPLTDYPRRTNTKEMSQPYSVTENTTRLLDDQTSDAEN